VQPGARAAVTVAGEPVAIVIAPEARLGGGRRYATGVSYASGGWCGR